MKDEEMAKQFADNISGLDLTCSLLSAKDKSHAYRLGRYDGFLAGLKAGRPQWHDLEKDPTDEPKENKKYWILTSDREPKVDSWLSISWVYSYDVIAWCEIPTFDKE